MSKIHQQIADEWRAKILRGDIPLDRRGQRRLPLEVHLAAQYGVNRNTVRKAMSVLAGEGLIDIIRGIGSVVRDRRKVRLPVTRPPREKPWQTACAAQGFTGATDLIAVNWVSADPVIAAELEIPAGDAVCCRQAQMKVLDTDLTGRYCDEVVLQLQDTWLPQNVAVDTPLGRPARVPGGISHGLVAAGHTMGSVREVMGSRMPTPQEREVFGMGPGSPVLEVRRSTRDTGGGILVHVHLVINSDHVELVSELEL